MLTTQIAEVVESATKPQGVGIVVEARRLCMMMRGVEKQHSSTITSAMQGGFREKETRNEFLAIYSPKTQYVLAWKSATWLSELAAGRVQTGANRREDGLTGKE